MSEIINLLVICRALCRIVAVAPPAFRIREWIGPHVIMPERHVEYLPVAWLVARQRKQVGDVGCERHAALGGGIRAEVKFDGVTAHIGDGLGRLDQ